MNWEHSHLSMAPRAGRVDELRAEAASHRQAHHLIERRRSRTAEGLRSRVVLAWAALASRVARFGRQQEQDLSTVQVPSRPQHQA